MGVTLSRVKPSEKLLHPMNLHVDVMARYPEPEPTTSLSPSVGLNKIPPIE